MAYFRYILLAMLFSLVFPAGCASWHGTMRDPVAQSGASSEEIWYRNGGARVAYTAVARPKQLHTGYGVVWDPALYEQAPATVKAPPKKKASLPKTPTAPPRPPDCPPCPPCPPADAAASVPQSLNTQASPASSVPAQDAADSAPPAPAALVPDGAGVPAPPPPPRIPLPGMPSAAPMPITPDAPAR